MRTATFVFLLVVCSGWAADLEGDNKATESKSSPVVAVKDDKAKPEKRAPLVMTSVPGELKYTPDVTYSQDHKYTPMVLNPFNPARQETKYQEFKLPFYYQPTPAPKPQYVFYNPPPPMHNPMVLMFAVPHPSGQFLMLLPAHNFLHPMMYKPQFGHSPVQYQQHYASPTGPALAQAAGFAAQQQLAYSGPYQHKDKYASTKQ
ncbi:uncharacterized protein LOC106673092 [Cimex lectularius]|uniref:CPR type cuticle protein n=1 Tax=Cimex lectularius TaxID=79782 RepID=A0A8I6SC74_CIMLE|nr:uncharacterized protein LOC106673092 [Cimex lectularius]